MALSKREQLKQANMRNAATRGNTSTNETSLADFVNRNDNSNNKDGLLQQVEKQSPEKTESLITNNNNEVGTSIDKKILFENENISRIQEPIISGEEQGNNVPEYTMKNEIIVIDNQDIIKEKDYTGELKAISVSAPDKVLSYLELKANFLQISIKQLFTNMMLDEFNNGYSEEDLTLIRKYQYRQGKVSRKTIFIPESFKTDINKYAAKYMMKSTNFVAYVIEKRMLKDSEFINNFPGL